MEGTFGNCPGMLERANLEIIAQEIPARSGQALGRICVALPIGSKGRIATEELGNMAGQACRAGHGNRCKVLRLSYGAPSLTLSDQCAESLCISNGHWTLRFKNGKTSFAKFGLLYIDLDGFKQVNDQFGQATSAIGICKR